MPKCRKCRDDIPPARLAAVPNATLCVSCLTQKGDVPRLRLFEDHTIIDGDMLSHNELFIRNVLLDTQLRQLDYTGRSVDESDEDSFDQKLPVFRTLEV